MHPLSFLHYDYLFLVIYLSFCCNGYIIFIVYWFSLFKDILRSNVYCAVAPFKCV